MTTKLPQAPTHQADNVDSTDDEVQPVAVTPPPTSHNKTLRAIHQLSTFYNPDATAYLVDNHSVSSEDTKSTIDWEGRWPPTSQMKPMVI